MLSSKENTLENIVKLSDKETRALNAIIKILTAEPNDQNAKDVIVQTLTTYPLRLLYAFSFNSEILNELLETDPILNRKWATFLKTLHYPYHEISSCDGTLKISLFTQLKGAYLLSELAKHSNLADRAAFPIMNKACELGIYHALIKRLNFFCDMLTNSDGKNPEMLNTYLQFILKDVATLSNLYWTMGNIDVTLILFNTVNKMFAIDAQKNSIDRFFFSAKTNHFSWLQKYDVSDKPYPIMLLEVAVENLYLARLLHDMPASQRITAELSRANNAFEGFEGEFSDFADLQHLAMKKMHALHVPLVATFCQVAFDHATARINELFPDHVISAEISPANIQSSLTK